MMDQAHAKQREETLGSTEVAPILGLSPWANAFDVWAQHIGLVEREDISKVPAVEVGVFTESGILDWAAGELGAKIERNTLYSNPILRLSAQLDGVIEHSASAGDASGIPVEAKTAGLFGPLSEDWGEPGTSEIPAHYIVQCQVQMILAGADICHVAALLGGKGFTLFKVPRCSEKAEKTIKGRVLEIWDENIGPALQWIAEGGDVKDPFLMTFAPPEPPSMAIAKLLPREPGKVTALSQSDWLHAGAWQALKQEIKEKTSEMKAMEGNLIMSLGDAENGSFPDGTGFTFREQTRRSLDSKKIKAEYPDIAKECVQESTFRVARFAKNGV